MTVLKEISLAVHLGEMVAVMGPSGSGKSTLLFMLGLFLSPTKGDYFFHGQDVSRLNRGQQALFRRKRVGFVFQSADLIENCTIYENLEFPLIYSEVKKRERPDLIERALSLVNLDHRVDYPANKLSGGERQRVCVARALVNQPEAILADEPTGQLDRDNSQVIMNHFERIVSPGDKSVLIVTHDPAVAERCRRTFIMENGVLSEK